MIITPFLAWTYALLLTILIVLSFVLGYHISEDSPEAKAYAGTGRMRVRTGITASLATLSAVAGGVGSSITTGLSESNVIYWLDYTPWIIISIAAFVWWIAHLNHLYRVVRVEEAGLLTAVDTALKIPFPVTSDQLKQLEAIFE